MSLRTEFTDMFSLEHPIVLAPMGVVASGSLAAAVSNGGGLGLVGCGHGDREEIERELPIVSETARGVWGVGFIAWAARPEDLSRALEFRPPAVMLSFGDPAPLAPLVLDAGAKLLVQVTSLTEATRARDVGASVIVAQGTEAGGHGGGRSTLPFVPAVVDLVAPVPVLAAGGIADGRGVAAALCLGAGGALIGTRFIATNEANITPAYKGEILRRTGDETERSELFDLAASAPWPKPYTMRYLRNRFLDGWRGREDELAADADTKRCFADAIERYDLGILPVAAGEAVDLIGKLESASDLVGSIARQAEQIFALRAGAE
jgi:nitronate monooxygenase